MTVEAILDFESLAAEITRTIPKYSVAFQIADVSTAITPSPVSFGIKKTAGTTGFEISKKTLETTSETTSEIFSEEALEDVINVFGYDGEQILADIAANEISAALDETILTYLDTIATVVSPVGFDFSTQQDHLVIARNLIIAINKMRFSMAAANLRGLPQVLIVSPNVAALLSSSLTFEGSDSDNYCYVGRLGSMNVYMDLYTSTDYAMVLHKSFINGDGAIALLPLGLIHNWTVDSDTGQPKMNFRQRFRYGRNPLDASSTADSIFASKMGITLTDF